jgi:hypothetical protein
MKTTSQKKNTGLQAESAHQTNTAAPQVVSTTATAPERKDTRLPIDTEARKRNRSLPTEKVLNLLQTGSPDIFSLAEVVGKWVWVTFQEQPAAEIRQTLAQLGFHWNRTRQAWQHPCGNFRIGTSGDPREKYPNHFPADHKAA